MKNIDQKFSFSFLKTFTEEIFVSLLLVLASQQVFAQVNEKFDDGNFTDHPQWIGNTDWFDASSHELQLLAPAESGTAYLSTPSASIVDASWEVRITLQFNPSSSNFARYYLVSDQPDLSGPLNGYFIMIGGTTDEISLFKQAGTTSTKLIDGQDGLLNSAVVNVTVKATRDAVGNWDLLVKTADIADFVSQGHVEDIAFLTANYSGIWCRYTATRSDKFSFDDIFISGDPYIPPPPAAWKDVMITEIFPDPSPRQELPDSEYIEIYNASETNFNLRDWTLSDGSQSAVLPEYELIAGTYLIVTSATAVENFLTFGDAIGLSGFPSLNNTSDNVILKNATLQVVDSLQYNLDWYHDEEKKDGGWSIEIIDIKNLCGEENNWTASENVNGGTPAAANSIAAEKPDLHAPSVVSVIPVSDSTLIVSFDEKLERDAPSVSCFAVAPMINIDKVTFTDHALRKVKLQLTQKLSPHTTYTITISGVSDCAGNAMVDSEKKLFALPEGVTEGDVVLNEVLFNPRTGGVDFVEVFNVSSKYINIKNWSLANVDEGQLKNTTLVCHDDFLLEPQAYMVFTSDGKVLKSEYIHGREETFVIAPDLPSLPDDEGNFALANEHNSVIDQLHYSSEMHNAFLKDDEGVSLERIDALATGLANWTSAASDAGFATPGYRNTCAVDKSISTSEIIVDPEIFEPITGQPGFTRIHYRFEQGGKIANVKILDSQGHLIREVANNMVLGTEGFFRWDGDHSNGSKARVGYYMVWFEVFDGSGRVQTMRERIAIAGQF